MVVEEKWKWKEQPLGRVVGFQDRLGIIFGAQIE